MNYGHCRTIAAIGRNYVAHALELKNPLPKYPFFFLKPVSSLVTPDDVQQIVLPAGVGSVHHEAELAVVIGKRAKNVGQDEAMDFVSGYAIAIDVTARDLQEKAKSEGKPWTVAKGFDTFCPISAFISKEDIPDPHNVTLFLKINGVTKQKDSTSLMIFKIPELIAAVTKVMTLNEGDIILTGTPKGVGPLW